MKSINARTALISVSLGLAVVTPSQAEDYYIYQAPNGALVISNKEPPPGSKIIKQQNFAEATDNEVPQAQEPDKTNGQKDTLRIINAMLNVPASFFTKNCTRLSKRGRREHGSSAIDQRASVAGSDKC